MKIRSVVYRRISEKERDEILENGFDPPTTGNPEEFRKEIRQVCDRVRSRLSDSWQYGIGEGDFFIHTLSEEDRMLCVEIANPRIINDVLLEIAQRAVADLAKHYCIDFCNNWFRLKTFAGEPYPDFNILVSKTQILIYSECDDLLLSLEIGHKLNN
jgi:hypothetical protein